MLKWVSEERYKAKRGEGKSLFANAASTITEAFSPHSATQVARL